MTRIQSFIISFCFVILTGALLPVGGLAQCDPDGVWLERQAYTSSNSLLLGLTGCVRSAVVISPLQIGHDTLRIGQAGAIAGYVLTWNGTAWAPAETDRQTLSAGDGSGTDKTINLSDGGGNVTLRASTNVTITRSGDTIIIAATAGGGGDPSVTNEGSLTVGAGGSNTSTIVSNTSGSTPVTVSGSNTILVTESGSTITLQGDTSLLATVNDLNTQRTFVKVGTNGDANYNVNAYRNGTTGFRTQDTTGVVDIKVVSLTKPGLYQEGKTGQSVMFTKFAPVGYSGLTGLGSFNITGGYYTGVNSPISSRPNYVYDIGYNLKPGGTRENTHEPTLGFGFETFYANAALHVSDGFMEGHWHTMDTFGVEHRHISFVAPWNGKRNRDIFSIASDRFNLLDFGETSVWAVRPNSNLWSIADTTLMQFTEPRGFGLSVYNGAGSAGMSIFDFNNTDTLEVGRTILPATRINNMLIVNQSKIYPRWTDNELQIGSSSSPNRRADLWINQKTGNGLRLIGTTRTWAFENSGNLAINDITGGTTPLYLYTGNNDAAFVFRSNRFGINVPGASPTQPLHVVGNARVTGAYYDSNNDPGTLGQILSSTVTGTDWITAATGTITAAENGLYVSGTTIRMGTNPLIEATLIDQDANDMRFFDGKWSYSSRPISWTPTQGMGIEGLEASPTTNSTPTQDGIVEFAVTNSSNSLQSNSLTIGAYATDADGVWMQARSNAVPNVSYPLQLQPRGGKFSVGRVTATLAKATFAAVALPGATASGSVIHWESTEGNKKAAATFGVGTDVVDGEIAYFDSLDITRITNRNTTTGTSSVRIAVGGETSDRVTVVASSVTPSARMGIGITAPTSTLHSAGSLASACTTFSGAITLDERDNWRAYTGTTDVTVTLPAASTCAGREYTIHHRGTAGTLTLSIAINKGNGATFNTLAAGQFAFIKSDGTAWNGIKLASL